jgi:lipopolysaccharide export system protein LptA
MTPIAKLLRHTLPLFALLFLSSSLQALPEDRDKPVQVSAQRMEWHNERQVGIYQGEVEASQGELRLAATTLTLYRAPQGQLDRLLAEGTEERAYMRDRPNQDQPEVEAWAESIDYYPAEEKIILTGQAHLRQGEDNFRGHRLTYHLTTQDLVAEQAESEDSRIEVILTPKRNGN